MITLSDEQILAQHKNYMKAWKSSQTTALPFEVFIASSLERLFEQRKNEKHPIKFPYEVKIAKDVNALLEKDTEPAQIIRIEEPIMKEFTYSAKDENGETAEITKKLPVWFGTTSEEFFLRYGYKNGDSRFLSTYSLGDQNVSSIMGGATGQGKSVALNNIIFSLAMEYPPWELDIVMSDAKIVEFKKYAQLNPLPHISAIAATGDADYLIGIYEDLYNKMILWNSVFPLYGCANIMDFRKATGLCIPRHVIIADEFQTMFKNAGKQLSHLVDIIDKIARLGRATGYHLLFCSQEISNDIPADTLGNIKLRSALGCTPEVSEKLLGNSKASQYYGKKGYLVVNDNPTLKGAASESNTVMYRVPYLEAQKQNNIGKKIIVWGREYDFARALNFYDELAVVRESKYLDYISQFSADKNVIRFGEPAYVHSDSEQVVSIEFENSSLENLMFITLSDLEKRRMYLMMRKNLDRFGTDVTNFILDLDRTYSKYFNTKENATAKATYSDNRMYMGNQLLYTVNANIYRRRCAIEIDKNVSDDDCTSEIADKMLEELIEEGLNLPNNRLNRSRCYYVNVQLRNKTPYREMWKLEDLQASDTDRYEEEIHNLAKGIMQMYVINGAANQQLTASMFKPIYVWVLGLESFVGIGRDSQYRQIEEFKKVLMDSSDVAVRFLLFTSTIDEMEDLRVGIRWFIGKLTSQQISKLKADEVYPDNLTNNVSVLYNSQEPKYCKKFKKMYFDKEMVV